MNRTPANRNAVVNSCSNSMLRNVPVRTRRLTFLENFAIVVMSKRVIEDTKPKPVSIGKQEQKLTTVRNQAGSTTPEVVPESRLPFDIRVATSTRDIDDLVALRSETYAKHGAPGAHLLKVAEAQDGALDAVLLVARAKIGGGVLGSVRIQTRAVRPLPVEGAVEFPPALTKASPIELMRGSVRGGSAGRLVSAALAKASFLVATELGFSHMLVTCRQPVDLMYRTYRFDDLLEGQMISLPYSPGALHRVLCLPVDQAPARWQLDNPALLEFMLGVRHPDLLLDFDLIRRRLGATPYVGEAAVA